MSRHGRSREGTRTHVPALALLLLGLAALGGAGCRAASRARPAGPAQVPPPAPEEPQAVSVAPGPAWVPDAPDADEFDWIQLDSGEWLKGKLIVLRKDALEFESDELGDLNLDWAKVREFHSARQNTVRLRTGEVFIGTASMVDGRLEIEGAEGRQSFPGAQLYTLLPGQPSERSYWSGQLTLGLTARSGNTDQADVSTYTLLNRRTAASRFLLTFNGIYSEIDQVATADNQRLDTSFRLFVDDRLYVTPLALTASRDPFQNIALRATPGSGVGYMLIDRGDRELEVSSNLGLIHTRYESVQPGEAEKETSAALLLGTRLDQDITAKVDLLFVYNLQLALGGTNEANHHAELRLSVDLLKDLSLDTGLIWDRVGNATPDDEGNIPSADDFRLSLGLGWNF